MVLHRDVYVIAYRPSNVPDHTRRSVVNHWQGGQITGNASNLKSAAKNTPEHLSTLEHAQSRVVMIRIKAGQICLRGIWQVNLPGVWPGDSAWAIQSQWSTLFSESGPSATLLSEGLPVGVTGTVRPGQASPSWGALSSATGLAGERRKARARGFQAWRARGLRGILLRHR